MNVEEIDWSEEIDEDEYINYLNEVYGDIDVCGLSYPAGKVQKDVDLVAFNEGYNNFIDFESKERDSYRCGKCQEVYCYEEEAEDCCKE